MQVKKHTTQGVTFQKEATEPLGDDDIKQLGSLGLRLEILERVYRMLSRYCCCSVTKLSLRYTLKNIYANSRKEDVLLSLF